jgi:ABC-type transport system substrate-binding protein
MPARALFFGLPAFFIALTLWAAQQARLNRQLRQHDLFALVSDPGLPSVNPYQAGPGEAARQLTALVHASLFKLNDQGRIAPDLASEWHWRKRVTVWFETEAAAAQAAQDLEALKHARWPAWKLADVSLRQTALQLWFDDVREAAVREVLQAAKARVVPVTILRVSGSAGVAAVEKALLNQPDLATPRRQAWHDEAGALELALAPMPDDYLQRLRDAVPGIPLQLEVRARQPVFEEPLLEVTIRADARWHDGTRVTATDVQASFEALSRARWPLPNRAGLLATHKVEVVAPNRLRMALWRQYGPALSAWTDLPILPAAWWKAHDAGLADKAFHQSPPQGAGPCMVTHRGPGLLVLEPVEPRTQATRLSLVASLSGFHASLGFTSQALDLYWPSTPTTLPAVPAAAMTRRASPARELMQVHWNTRSELLASLGVRQALAAGVNRDHLIQKALGGQARPHGTFFAPRLWLSSQPTPGAGDSALAERLLEEAGWLRNVQGIATQPGRELAFQLALADDDPALLRVAAELRLQWLALGAQVKLRLLSPEALNQALAARAFDAVLTRSPPLTSWDLGDAWHSRGANNVTGLSNRRLDLLVEALMQEFDPGLAAKNAREAEALILDSQAVLPLVLTHETASLRPGLAVDDTTEGWTLRNLLLR